MKRGPEYPILKSHGLTYAQSRALDHVARMDKFGWLAATGRSVRASTMRELAAKGLVRDAGDAVVVDGDGHALEPERYRRCWEFTDTGRLLFRACEAALSAFWAEYREAS